MNKLTNFIGVKRIILTPVMKRDLLLFDQLAIEDFEKSLTYISDRSKTADLEWLHNKGLIFDLNYQEAVDEMFEEYGSVYQLMALSGALVVLAATLEPPESSNHYITKNVDLFSKMGVRGYFDYSLRVLSLYLEDKKKVRAVPLFMALPDRKNWDILENIEKVCDSLQSFPTAINSPYNFKALVEVTLDIAENIKNRKFDPSELGNIKESNVVEVVLKNIPIPDEDVPWEQILNFRSDENSKIYAIKLRQWMKKIGNENMSNIEIQEELEDLLASYQDHMRFHKMKTQLGIVETIVSLPLNIAEHLIKFKWSDAAKSLFSLRQRKLVLMEAERSAPGREVAYIIKTKEEFNC